jgi:hypothetical protein
VRNSLTRDLRKYTQQTNTRLIIGGILLLFIVGDGLIYLIYGLEAALTGLICLTAGLSPLLLIWLFLIGIELIVKASNKD